MRSLLNSVIGVNRDLVFNASSLVGTTVVASGLGFIYWWLAARLFPPVTVGFAAAAISAMLILGNVGMFGLGTLLIGELQSQPTKAGSLITTSLLLAGTMSAGLGILFAYIAPYLSVEFEGLANGFESILLFTAGVMLTAVGLVLDHALIGLLRGKHQLLRNSILAVSKLCAIWIAGVWFAGKLGLMIYATWVIGILISFAVLAGLVWFKGIRITYRPQLGLIREFGYTTLGHHALNMALQVPGLLLPVMVTVLLSAKVNASFYAAWVIAGFLFVAPYALTTVLYAVGVVDPSELAHKTRFTLKLSLLAGMLGSVFLIISATFILSLFGSTYVDQAAWSLRILALGVFPIIVRVHYVAICRVQGQIIQAAKIIAITSLFILILAALGARTAGLTGLCLGWLVGMCLEAIILTPVVIRSLDLTPVSLTSR